MARPLGDRQLHVRFNHRHDRAGHFFQGRFNSVVIEDDAGWQEVARYIHLNPVYLDSAVICTLQIKNNHMVGICLFPLRSKKGM